MDPVDVDFLQQLRATFAAEAQEHLQVVTAGLLELERELPVERRRAVVENVFRAAHSLKGAARAVEFGEIESVCQALEDSFAAWKQQDSGPTAVALDALHGRLNRLAKLLAPASPPAPAPVAAAAAAARIQPEPAVPLGPNLDVPPRAPGPGPETVRVRADVLDARLLEVEELLAVKLAARQRVEELRELALQVQGWHGADTMVPGPAQLQALELALASSARAAERDRDTTARLVDDLLANVKQLLLLPFGAITAGLPKLVRDLCRAQGKEAELRIEGEDIPLDKRILDALRDPLLHLLRNCIDHGVEPPAERQRRGKPARAQVRLAATPLAGHRVQITLADDGAGLDLAGIQAAAVRQGLVGAQEAAQLAPQEAQALVFRSGLSTRTEVTDLSGRGLGLAIVQENVTRLGGEVTVESRPGAGTVFRLVLPARRASFRGILVRAAGQLLVVPTRQVERVARIPADAVRALDAREAITLDGRVLPFVRLAQVLQLATAGRAEPARATLPLVVLGQGELRVAFEVDEVLEEQELLPKPLLPPLVRVRNVASATVLPTGRVALVLHVSDLLQSARAVPAGAPRPAPGAAPPAARSVLVAEDSITSRLLLQGILEAAGFVVSTAVDGLDAWERLVAGRFDLLVSDVEMPRLDGFDLTARVRGDERLAHLPVVLVTALADPAQRARGMDAGADAYIAKGGFEQDTLLEAARRLTGTE